MNRRYSRASAPLNFGTVLMVGGLLSLMVGLSAAAPASALGADSPAIQTAAGTASSITTTVASVSPISPPAVVTDTIVTVVVSVTNNTNATLQKLSIQAVRDAPIIRQSTLDATLAHPAPPVDFDLTQPLTSVSYPNSVAAHQTLQLSYRFPASTTRESGGVCLCQAGIYPIDLSIFAASSSKSSTTQIGWMQTYLISSTAAVSPIQVSWLWPLIDRPHRLSDDDLFSDDDLAASVSVGGRLDRALQAIEKATEVFPAGTPSNPPAPSPAAPVRSSGITLAIDPELIDELAVMASGYRVRQGSGYAIGTNGAPATAWLGRLRAVLPQVRLTLTPYDDPDVNAVLAAGLSWAAALPLKMHQRIDAVLATTTSSTLAWPPGETVTPAALTQLVSAGATSVVLGDATLPGGRDDRPPPSAMAELAVAAGTGSVRALVTSQALERRIGALLGPDGSAAGTLPALMAELAVRSIELDHQPSYVVLSATRYVNTNPTTAATVIDTTSGSGWTSPLYAADAATSIAAVSHGTLVAPVVDDPAPITRTMLAQARSSSGFARTFGSAVSPAAAADLLAAWPATIQGCESAAWSQNLVEGRRFAALAATQTQQLVDGVRIVRPSSGAYSLASSSAPLLVTVANTLPVSVMVRVRITSAGGVAGFRTDDAGVQTIPASSRRTIKVQAHVARSGHLRVQAQLLAPDGGLVGAPLPLSIYSSALGTIGVVITIIAAAVLVLAVLNRFRRRWRHHRITMRELPAGTQVVAGGHG